MCARDIASRRSPCPRNSPRCSSLAAGGCRMCSDCCDYSPPVPGGLPLGLQRAGSALSGNLYVEPPTPEAPAWTASPLPALTPSPKPLSRLRRRIA